MIDLLIATKSLYIFFQREQYSIVRQFSSTYFDISDWEFFSPSTVNGDAPVNSSYVNTPNDHQSTAWKQRVTGPHIMYTNTKDDKKNSCMFCTKKC